MGLLLERERKTEDQESPAPLTKPDRHPWHLLFKISTLLDVLDNLQNHISTLTC